jgi:hypothetical protein
LQNQRIAHTKTFGSVCQIRLFYNIIQPSFIKNIVKYTKYYVIMLIFVVEAQAIVVQTTCNAPGTLPVGCTGTGAKPCQFCQPPAEMLELRGYTDAGMDASLCSVDLSQFSEDTVVTFGYVDENDIWTEAPANGFEVDIGTSE